MVRRRLHGRELGRLEFTADHVSHVRAAVRRMVAGLDCERADDVVLAVHEVAVNSVVHGVGAGRLHGWDDGRQLVFEVENRRDRNTTPTMRAPTSDQPSGRGLWLARHLVDDLSVDVTPDSAVVRLRLFHAEAAPAS